MSGRPVKLYVCTCPSCVTQTCTDDGGNQQCGQFVSRQVQRKHHRAHFQDEAFDPSSREPSPEPAVLHNDQDAQGATLNAAFEDLQLDEQDPSLTVLTLVGIFLGWLHLYCGVSQNKCQIARAFILEILGLAGHHPILDNTDHHQLPKDIRTTIGSLCISPHLDKHICCPTCFSLYAPGDAPWLCSYKKSPKARECGEELFVLKAMYRGIRDSGRSQIGPSIIKNISPSEVGQPRNIYMTQKFSMWLPWFLCKSKSEEEIEPWSTELKHYTGQKIYDIQQSQVWKDVTWPNSTSTGPEPLNLTFSFFVDWFNPRGNKKRGAQQSMGVLALNCLNLPPSLRNLTQNTCVAGITPGPATPDMMTVSHILEGLIDDLLLLENGITMGTYQHPEGRLVRVKLLPILGDMVGMHKVAGYALHSATLYCSWCWARSTDMEGLMISKLRTKDEVVHASKKSKSSLTLNKKNIILKETGIRWSELTRLEYRDPVNHLPLGMMHNWFKGVLHHHFWYRWGFVLYTQEQKQSIKKKRGRDREAADIDRHPRKRVVYEEGGGNAMEEEDNDDLGGESESCDSEIDADLEAGWDGGLFSKADIILFQKLMHDVVLPTGVSRIPGNIGEASAGSMKAAQWHALFAYVIPLIVLELYVVNPEQLKKNSNNGQILSNIGSLCRCTNIVCAKHVSEYDANQFKIAYRKYSFSSKAIFPNLAIKPNHHYALHIPSQIRLWGPLISVAEFTGERLIGTLQKIRTNGRLGQMDATMMKRFAQWQRLQGDNPVIEAIVSENSSRKKKDPGKSRMRIQLEIEEYTALLAHVQEDTKEVCDYRWMPHPPGSKVLQPYAIPRSVCNVTDSLLVSVIKPNNCIKFMLAGKTRYGMVRQIYEFLNINETWSKALLVNPIGDLYPKDLESPSRHFRFVLFLLKCVLGQVDQEFVIVSPATVKCVAAYRLLPDGTFGIQHAGIILRPCDYNSELEIV